MPKTTKEKARRQRKELKSVPNVCFSFRSYLAATLLFVIALAVILGFQYLQLSAEVLDVPPVGLGPHWKLQPGRR